MDKNSKELLTATPLNIMVKLSIPAIIGMIVIGLYPLMDGIFAGQLLGQDAMTAVGVAMPFTYFNTGIATLIGVGSASVLSRAIGERNQNTIDKIMNNLLYWVILLSVIITIIGFLFSKQFLSLVGASGNILDLATRYLKIIFIGSLFVNFAQAANMVMRGEGLMKRAMLIMGIGAVINIILDPIFMISMGDRGIEGAAIATITAQIIQAIITFYYFKYKSNTVKINKIISETSIYKEVFSIGVSAMLMQVLTIIQQSLLYNQAFRYGEDEAGSIMAASLRILAFSFIPIWGMSQGLQPAIGANFGAKQYDRVRSIFKIFTIYSIVLAAIFWIPSIIFTKPLLSLFGLTGNSLINGVTSFRILYSAFILYGVMIMLLTFFQAIGDAKSAGRLVMLRQVIIFVPAMIILPMFFGLKAVWFTTPVIDILIVVLGMLTYLKTIKKFN
ncbi:MULTISPECIES: MATE family efflux transporter [Gemella]|uniref:MATE family efflux transporter n=1 Tax=Gemella TaxID=1378 RepID=UPI0007683344|nr:MULTISPECIES: MATE family efflux transporter [Gemella]AME09470.1 MATE family efflux transporter [Gemella sp. oral taxon 928]AXI27110.1 MATE family efflux transporter [Gemella sp. ND 6198]